MRLYSREKYDEVTSRSLNMFERCGDSEGLASLAVLYARLVYIRRGEFEQARKLVGAYWERFKDDERLDKRVGMKVKHVARQDYLGSMTSVEIAAKNYDAAISYCNQYVDFFRERRDDPETRWPQKSQPELCNRVIESKLAREIGQCYFNAGQYKAALDNFNHYILFVQKNGLYPSWDDARKNPPPDAEFEFYVQLYVWVGECHYDLGDKQQALKAFETASRNLERGDIMHARPWREEFTARVNEMKEKTLPLWIAKCK
jgi:tetratricopeptide (TPR) repeat protein